MPNLLSRLRTAIFPSATPAPTTPTTKSAGYSTGGQWTTHALTAGFGLNHSGPPVTTQSVMGLPVVYAAARAISEDVAKLPLTIQRRTSRGAWINDPDHRLNKVIRRPNPWLGRFDAISAYVTALTLRGNGYAAIVRGPDGEVTGWVPVSPDYADVYLDQNTGDFQYRVQHPLISGLGFSYLRPEDVAHIRNTTHNGGIKGLSPIAVAAEALGIALATQEYAARVFGQGAGVGGVLSTEGELAEGAGQAIAQGWADAYSGVANAHKVVVLEGGMKFIRTGLNADEAQWIESRKFSILDGCRIFRVPPSKVMDFSEAHYNNLESENEAYVLDTIMPTTTRIEEAFGEAMLWPWERENVRFHFDTDPLTRADRKTRFDTYRTGIETGIMSRNEARALEGMAPVEGGDTYLTSLNVGNAKRDSDRDGTPDAVDPKPNDPDITETTP